MNPNQFQEYKEAEDLASYSKGQLWKETFKLLPVLIALSIGLGAVIGEKEPYKFGLLWGSVGAFSLGGFCCLGNDAAKWKLNNMRKDELLKHEFEKAMREKWGSR